MKGFKLPQDHDLDIQCLQQKLQQASGKIVFEKPHVSATLRNTSYPSESFKLNLGSLDKIISIDPNKRIAIVEPGVTMELLCAESLRYKLVPPVIPEFKNITVGGAIMGAAIESSSFKYGLFSDICLSYQLLLANGTIIDVSPLQHADLFYGISGSYGTLAIILQITLSLIPIKPYVKITCSQFSNANDFSDALTETIQNSSCDYVDGIAFSKNSLLLMKGYLVDKCHLPLFHLENPWDQWFIQRLLKNSTIFLPIRDYLFRYDKAAFWMGSIIAHWDTFLKIFLFWNKIKKSSGEEIRKLLQRHPLNLDPNFLLRFVLAKASSSEYLYTLFHEVPVKNRENALFIHDFVIPPLKFVDFIDYAFEKADIAPLWLCPIKTTTTPQYLAPHYNISEKFLINVGIYGCAPKAESLVDLSKNFESYVDKIGGRKFLYSLNYYSEEEFWKSRNQPFYQHLRDLYGGKDRFQDLYQKISERRN